MANGQTLTILIATRTERLFAALGDCRNCSVLLHRFCADACKRLSRKVFFSVFLIIDQQAETIIKFSRTSHGWLAS